MEPFGTRARNRALLARQHLLERIDEPLEAVIEHLVGLQAQESDSPYLAAWARVARFAVDDLTRLLVERRAVRMTLIRGTIHLVTAADARRMRPVLQPMIERISAWSSWGQAVGDLDLAALVATGREILDEPRTNADLAAALRDRWPDTDPKALANAARFLVPSVQVPPRGTWRTGGTVRWAAVDSWLGPSIPERGVGVDDLVRRYLGAFGPAVPADAQTWSGLTRLGEVFERLRPELVVLVDDDGRERFDLPDAPRPGADVPAPVRFLPGFDNVLLSHADRTHVVPADHRPRLAGMNGLPPATVLVDGFVRAAWRLERPTPARRAGGEAVLTVRPFTQLTRAELRAVEREAEAVAVFAAPDADDHVVRVASPS